MSLADDKTMVNIGKFGAAVGIRGEIKVFLYSDYADNLYEGAVFLVNTSWGAAKRASDIRELNVCAVRYQKGKAIIRLENIEDRNAAEKLTNLEFFIRESELVDPGEGSFYFRDLIGLRVKNFKDGNVLGRVSDIIENPAHTIIEIEKTDGKMAMIPFVDQFIKNVSITEGVITVALIPGLVD